VPAKAGIQGERHERALDPRFRGGDDTFGNLRKVVLGGDPGQPLVLGRLRHGMGFMISTAASAASLLAGRLASWSLAKIRAARGLGDR
jgi:hypothetical protein